MRMKQTAYWINEKLLDEIKSASIKLDITVSEFTRRAIISYLKEIKED